MHQKPVVLVVEDNEENIDILLKLLTGYDVVVALDGPSALDILREEPVDMVLLDIMMPGMDGFQVCRIIKSEPAWKDIPVIFITAKTDTEDIVKGFEVGGVDYITKPFKPAELLARLKTHYELKRTRAELVTLRGIIPICASCKRIRDDKGSWNQLEDYISRHSEALFSHGICPKCLVKLYPDM